MILLLDGVFYHGQIFRFIGRCEHADIRNVAVNRVDVNAEMRHVGQRVETGIIENDGDGIIVDGCVLCHLIVSPL